MSLRKGILKSACIASFSMSIGDILMQTIEYNQGNKQSWDKLRTLRFSFVGLTLHGPYFHLGFGIVEKVFGSSRSVKLAMTKTIVSQITLFPVFLALLFPYVSLLEGKSFNDSIDKMKQVWWSTFKTGGIFWPCINMFNFIICSPGSTRVLCVSTAGVIWNCYISFINYKANQNNNYQIKE